MEAENVTAKNVPGEITQTIPEAKPTNTKSGKNVTHSPGEYRVIRRNSKVTAFDPDKISVAMTKAFLQVEGGTAAASTRIHERVASLSKQVVNALTRRMPAGGTVHIEDIQDQVELALMRAGEQKIARAYVIYRDACAPARTCMRYRTRAPKHPSM